MIQAEGTERVRLFETGLGYLSHSSKTGWSSQNVESRREAGEEPKDVAQRAQMVRSIRRGS